MPDTLLVLLLLCRQFLSVATTSPAEFFCIERECQTPFSSGVLVQDFKTEDGVSLSKDSPVDIVGKSASSGPSFLRVKVQDRFITLESSFVRELKEPDVRKLIKYTYSEVDWGIVKNTMPSKVVIHTEKAVDSIGVDQIRSDSRGTQTDHDSNDFMIPESSKIQTNGSFEEHDDSLREPPSDKRIDLKGPTLAIHHGTPDTVVNSQDTITSDDIAQTGTPKGMETTDENNAETKSTRDVPSDQRLEDHVELESNAMLKDRDERTQNVHAGPTSKVVSTVDRDDNENEEMVADKTSSEHVTKEDFQTNLPENDISSDKVDTQDTPSLSTREDANTGFGVLHHASNSALNRTDQIGGAYSSESKPSVPGQQENLSPTVEESKDTNNFQNKTPRTKFSDDFAETPHVEASKIVDNFSPHLNFSQPNAEPENITDTTQRVDSEDGVNEFEFETPEKTTHAEWSEFIKDSDSANSTATENTQGESNNETKFISRSVHSAEGNETESTLHFVRPSEGQDNLDQSISVKKEPKFIPSATAAPLVVDNSDQVSDQQNTDKPVDAADEANVVNAVPLDQDMSHTSHHGVHRRDSAKPKNDPSNDVVTDDERSYMDITDAPPVTASKDSEPGTSDKVGKSVNNEPDIQSASDKHDADVALPSVPSSSISNDTGSTEIHQARGHSFNSQEQTVSVSKEVIEDNQLLQTKPPEVANASSHGRSSEHYSFHAELQNRMIEKQAHSEKFPDLMVGSTTEGKLSHTSRLVQADLESPIAVADELNENSDVQCTKTSRDSHTVGSPHFPYIESSSDHLFRMGLFECISSVANVTLNLTAYNAHGNSPLLHLFVRAIAYFFSIGDIMSLRIPTAWRLIIDRTLTNTLNLPLAVLMAWVAFIFHLLIGWLTYKLFSFVLFKQLGYGNSAKFTSAEYLQLEERASELASRLTDQEEANGQLANWAAQLTLDLQQAEREKSSAIDALNERVKASDAELETIRSELSKSLDKYKKMEESYNASLLESEQSMNSLNSQLSALTEEKVALEELWKSKVTALEESNQKALEESKREHEELYYQALDYYGRMKAMRPEMDKLLEARKQAEDRLTAAEAELDSLRTTFTTLKSFELALEQEDMNREQRASPESSDYTMINRPVDEGDPENICSNGGERQSLSDKKMDDNDETTKDADLEDRQENFASKIKANLSRFLDIGRLQAKLELTSTQLKSEQSKSQCERQLREELESKVESMERTISEMRESYNLLVEDRNTVQTKLEVLSAYFKERELELQRDLGKHVVVGSESSEALNNCRKRNKELEAEVKALRDQIATLRRELAETERVGRRQVAELDKRSHENWLSARAADHQVQELREENASLRQKLIEAERSAIPPALRAQVLAPTHPFLPGPSPPRPNIPLTSSNNGSLDRRSLSGQSATSLSSQPPLARLDASPLQFPPPPPLPFPLPQSTSSDGVLQIPPPPPPPFLLQGRMPFPHGFPPPPPLPGAFPTQLNMNAVSNHSPASSLNGSNLSHRPT